MGSTKYENDRLLPLLELIAKFWDIAICFDTENYVFSTRLYPSDRYIGHTDKDFRNGLMSFISKIEEHAGNDVKKQIHALKESVDS